MPNLGMKVLLFLSSYAPLFLIFSLKAWHDFYWGAIGLMVLALVSLVALAIQLRVAAKIAPLTITPKAVSVKDGETMSYVVTYLLPFLSIDLKDSVNAISLVGFFSIVGVLYVNSNLVYTNPILNLAGYHLFEVEDESERVFMLITHKNYLRKGDNLSASPLSDNVLLERRP